MNSVGALVADPNDSSGNTLYLGTGEANRCSSGCESGVGIYKSTNGGDSWTKLADACVSNTTYSCANSGDAFLGRAISEIVVDPSNAQHIFAGSAQAVRGLSHVIGNGGQVRLEPGANPVGLYESTDGGATFTEVWNGNDASSFGVTDVALDPLDPTTVYASAFDQGLWRRSPSLDGSTSTLDEVRDGVPLHGPNVWLHLFSAALAGFVAWSPQTGERRSLAGDRRRAARAFAAERRQGSFDRRTSAYIPTA